MTETLRSFWDAALRHPRGVRLDFESYRHAKQTRARMYSFRTQERLRNRRLPVDDDLYNRTPWDELSVRLDGPHLFVRPDTPVAITPISDKESEQLP